MQKLLLFLSFFPFVVPAFANALVLGELPADQFCPNAPSTGQWNDDEGHCRFSVEGEKEEIAVISINGNVIRAKANSKIYRKGRVEKKRPMGDTTITEFKSTDGRVKVRLISRVTSDSCAKAKDSTCGTSYSGTVDISAPEGKATLHVSRYDGA